jgi:hypothetical protein
MLSTLVFILVAVIIISLVIWLVDYLPVVEPFNKMIKMIAIVFGVLLIIYALLSLVGIGGGLPALR